MIGIYNWKTTTKKKNQTSSSQLDLCETNHMQTRKEQEDRTIKSQMHEVKSSF